MGLRPVVISTTGGKVSMELTMVFTVCCRSFEPKSVDIGFAEVGSPYDTVLAHPLKTTIMPEAQTIGRKVFEKSL
jgi:hypothetical protein